MSILVPLLFLAGAGIVALAWPVARVAAFGQTASQGIAPIAHTLAAFGPGLVGYGVAFVMMRLLFALDDVRLSALVAVVGAVLGVVMMTVLSFVLADGDRAAALAIGYGTSQIVVAALLTARLRRLTGAMGARFTGRLVAESVAGAAAAAAAMLWLQARFAPTRRSGAVAILVAGVVGVVIFAGVLATLRRGKLLGAAELGRSGAT